MIALASCFLASPPPPWVSIDVRLTPPASLVELLTRLELAQPAEVRAVAGGVRRLSRGLPNFESVWVDALAQARVLTSFQAAEINAGRAEALRVGPYVLRERVTTLGYATVYHARELATQRDVRFALVKADGLLSTALAVEARSLVERWVLIDTPTLARVEQCGQHQYTVWFASRHVEGRSMAEWLAHNGRLPPLAAMEVARQMAAALAACEARGLMHGDLGARQLWVEPSGKIAFTEPGLRTLVCPVEQAAQADWQPAAYDNLAPERVAQGTLPNVASELFACGALWWHLLAGRPPFAGVDGPAKLRAAATARLADIAHLAPDTPPALVEVVRACLDRDPALRPKSFAEVTAALGPPTAEGQTLLATTIQGQGPSPLRLSDTMRAVPWTSRVGRWGAVAASVALVLSVATWPAWGPRWTASLKTQLATPAKLSLPKPVSRTEPTAPVTLVSANLTPAEMPRAADLQPPGTHLDGKTLVLPAQQSPIASRDVPLSPGRTICSPAGSRATIQVPHAGWQIDAENVQFENVDFVWESVSDPGQPSATNTMLELRVHRAAFTGCSWSTRATERLRPSAIVWQNPERKPIQAPTLAGELVLRDSQFTNVAVGVRRTGHGSIVIQAENVLHLGPGPLVQLDHTPRLDESMALRTDHVTLRDAAALLWCQTTNLDEPGRIAIETQDSVFVSSPDWALVVFAGRSDPGPILAELQWRGLGSVVSPQAPLVGWLGPEGRLLPAAEQRVRVEGVVRSRIDFAGEPSPDPSRSRIVHWQAPLRSDDSPGIRDTALPAPRPAD